MIRRYEHSLQNENLAESIPNRSSSSKRLQSPFCPVWVPHANTRHGFSSFPDCLKKAWLEWAWCKPPETNADGNCHETSLPLPTKEFLDSSPVQRLAQSRSNCESCVFRILHPTFWVLTFSTSQLVISCGVRATSPIAPILVFAIVLNGLREWFPAASSYWFYWCYWCCQQRLCKLEFFASESAMPCQDKFLCILSQSVLIHDPPNVCYALNAQQPI